MNEKENFISNSKFIDYEIINIPDTNKLTKDFSRNPKVLLAVYKEEDNTDSNLELLKKILGAVKFDFNDDVLLLPLTKKDQIKFQDVQNLKNLKYVFFFGISPIQLGLNFRQNKYQLLDFEAYKFLQTDSLEQIAKNTQLKGFLWNCLKSNFIDKA